MGFSVSSTSLLLLLAAALPFFCQSATVFNTRGIPFPPDRHVPWDTLDEASQQLASDDVGYTNFTWDNLGSNAIENLALSTIQFRSFHLNNSEAAALAEFGLDDEDQWDCWINHYEDYDWDEMEPEAEAGFVALGWNVSSWNGLIPYPPSEYTDWEDLTDDERQGAVETCFLNETWQEIPLPDWATDYANLAEEAIVDESLEETMGNTSTGSDMVDIMVSTSKNAEAGKDIAVDEGSDLEDMDAKDSSARSGTYFYSTITGCAVLLVSWFA